MRRVIKAALILAAITAALYLFATSEPATPCHFVGNTCITNPQPN
jgi:hypothetical protein